MRRLENIVVDARLLGPECVAADTGPIDIIRVDREPRLRDQFDDFTGSGDRFQPGRARLSEEDHRGNGFPAMNRGIANELVEFLLGLGAQNGFVGGADGAEHPVEPSHGSLAAFARSLVIEIAKRV